MNRPPLASIGLALGLAGCGGGGGGAVDDPGGPPGAIFVPGVAYVADADVDEEFELYVADLAGTEVRKISSSLPPDADVVYDGFPGEGMRVLWSPDGSLLAVPVSHGPDDMRLYVADPFGVNLVSLSLGPGRPYDYAWSPDSAHLAVGTSLYDPIGSTFTHDLRIATTTGASVSVTPSLPAGRSILGFRWAPNGARLAYAADEDTAGVGEIYTVLPDGSGKVKVSGPMAGGGVQHLPDGSSPIPLSTPPLLWAPSSSALIYRAAQEDVDEIELFLSTPDGSQNLRISADLAANQEVDAAAWAPDSSRVAYITGMEDGQPVLVTVLPNGTGEVRIKDYESFAGPDEVLALSIHWSPTSQQIAFSGVGLASFEGGLFVAAPTSTEATRFAVPFELFDPGPTGRPVTWSPQGDRIAVTPRGLGVYELYVIDPLTDDYAFVGLDVKAHEWAPDGSRIAHVDETGLGSELFVSYPDDVYGTVIVSPPLRAGVGVRREAHWTDDSSTLVYRADALARDVVELLASPRDSASLPRVLSGPLVYGGMVVDFELR